MAKKKTAEKANIKAAPVLRTDPAPDPEETPTTKSYCVRDDWKDKSIVNYVAFKSVDGEVRDLTVNGEPTGGGSLNTVEVDINNNTADTLVVAIPRVPFPEIPGVSIVGLVNIEAGMDSISNIIFDGSNSTVGLIVSQFNDVTFTGDVTVEDGTVFVNGDGSITVS